MIQLSFRDSRPMYEQVKDKIKELIVAKALKENEKIMSVRELASALTINPNTILKSYKELENEGYIYSVRGKGYFVADEKTAAESVNTTPLIAQVEETLKELYFLGEPKDKIVNMVNNVWEGKDND